MEKAQSLVGWVLVSKQDVAHAERALLDEVKGVRDELGILQLHQVISDTLFPGTSVLHTRLRYALFVPWMLRRAAEEYPRAPAKALERLEVQLTKDLIEGLKGSSDGDGVIGRRKSPEPAAQPPSFSYWTALSAWRILSPRLKGLTRRQVLSHMTEARSAEKNGVKDEQGRVLSEAAAAFAGLPQEPAGFWESRPTTFALRRPEANFLKRHLAAVGAPDGGASLLSRLAEADHAPGGSLPWLDPVVRAAATQQHLQLLDFARKCSSLGGICRGLYLAMVEQQAARAGFGQAGPHRDHLQELLDEHRDTALRLDLGQLPARGIHFHADDPLPALFRDTQKWLHRRRSSIEVLLPSYRETERFRKKGRARLGGTDISRARLALWADKESGAQAEALHFRWNNVRQLLTDLHAVPQI
jgi:hypothetical protein